jgi:hypothetical protein
MPSRKSEPHRRKGAPLGRRGFLVGAAAAGATGAAAGGAETSGVDAVAERKDRHQLGYRETEHIRAFYQRSRF